MPILPVTDRRPVAGFYADPAGLKLTGLERHRRLVRGEVRGPAVHHLTGLRLTDVSMGRATFAMPGSGWLASPVGFLSAGPIAFLADAPLSVAIESMLPPGKTSATSEISLNLISPAFPGRGNLTASARVIDVSSRLGFSEVSVHDQHGRLVSHGTSRCVIVDAPEINESGQRPVDANSTDDRRNDPWSGAPQGFVDPKIDRLPGIEAMQLFIDGDLEAPPVANLFGMRPIDVADGEITWTAKASPWWSSPGPFLYGGALSVLADVAQNTAFWTLLPAGSAYANLDLKIQFVRPVFADDRTLTARGFVTHRGRSIMIGGVEVENADGKTVLAGTGSAAVLPDGFGVLLAQQRA